MSQPPDTFFTCAVCGIELTDFLIQVSELSLHLEMEAPAVQAGHYLCVSSPWTYRDFVTGRRSDSKYLSPDGDKVAFDVNDCLLNIQDVRHLVLSNAHYGCCGLQPRDELNASCPNGHPIGTIHSDCWAASVFRLAHRHVQRIVASQETPTK